MTSWKLLIDCFAAISRLFSWLFSNYIGPIPELFFEDCSIRFMFPHVLFFLPSVLKWSCSFMVICPIVQPVPWAIPELFIRWSLYSFWAIFQTIFSSYFLVIFCLLEGFPFLTIFPAIYQLLFSHFSASLRAFPQLPLRPLPHSADPLSEFDLKNWRLSCAKAKSCLEIFYHLDFLFITLDGRKEYI